MTFENHRDFEKVYKSVQCALGKNDHILREAISLSCGHYVCKKCIPSENHFAFKCLKCGEVNSTNLSKCKESNLIGLIIENHIDDILKTLQDKIDNEIIISESSKR